MEKFLENLEKNGFSRWWFRNALAVMRDGDAKGENQAAVTLGRIILEEDFEEQVKVAGGDLVRKTYLQKASDGWLVVQDKFGSFDVLVDSSKFLPILSQGAEDFKRGFSTPFVSSLWVKRSLIIIGVAFLVALAIFI
ncbi:MAG: hypothetical protein KAQ63_00005 [Candidatus Moranbacteria bacterium]|nr:hypothetical protein [Candidatus Moranbacteria bacterium]